MSGNRLPIAAFLILMASSLLSQTTVVSGKVIDATTLEPLPFVNVAFLGTKIGTVTDLDGKYHLESYYASDSVVCSSMGYERQLFKIKRLASFCF